MASRHKLFVRVAISASVAPAIVRILLKLRLRIDLSASFSFILILTFDQGIDADDATIEGKLLRTQLLFNACHSL